jgi:hypothetical protein
VRKVGLWALRVVEAAMAHSTWQRGEGEGGRQVGEGGQSEEGAQGGGALGLAVGQKRKRD